MATKYKLRYSILKLVTAHILGVTGEARIYTTIQRLWSQSLSSRESSPREASVCVLHISTRMHELAIRLEANADLLDLAIPVRAQANPHSNSRTKDERHRHADPQPVQLHIAPKRQPDAKRNS